MQSWKAALTNPVTDENDEKGGGARSQAPTPKHGKHNGELVDGGRGIWKPYSREISLSWDSWLVQVWGSLNATDGSHTAKGPDDRHSHL